MVGANTEFFVHMHGQVASGVTSLEYLRHFADGSFDTGTVAVSIETGGGT
jgi:hypothetical protein